MDQKKLMEPLKLAGKLIMENGGETYRVEETVCRMGKAFGLREVESFAVPSGVFVSFQCEDGSIQTSVLRVHRGETNLSCVNEVNEVSREVEAGKLDWQGAWDALKAIEQEADPAPQGIRMHPWEAGLPSLLYSNVYRERLFPYCEYMTEWNRYGLKV